LVIFLFIPTKTSIISLALILFYILLISFFSFNQILILIFLNFFTMLIDLQLVEIEYKNSHFCDSKIAKDIRIKPDIVEGRLLRLYNDSINNYKCILIESPKIIKYL